MVLKFMMSGCREVPEDIYTHIHYTYTRARVYIRIYDIKEK